MVCCPKCFHDIQEAQHVDEDTIDLYCKRCDEYLGEFVRKR